MSPRITWRYVVKEFLVLIMCEHYFLPWRFCEKLIQQ